MGQARESNAGNGRSDPLGWRIGSRKRLGRLKTAFTPTAPAGGLSF